MGHPTFGADLEKQVTSGYRALFWLVLLAWLAQGQWELRSALHDLARSQDVTSVEEGPAPALIAYPDRANTAILGTNERSHLAVAGFTYVETEEEEVSVTDKDARELHMRHSDPCAGPVARTATSLAGADSGEDHVRPLSRHLYLRVLLV